MVRLLLLIVIVVVAATAAWAEKLTPEVEVMSHILIEKEDYPELFQGSECISKNCTQEPPYPVQLEGALAADLDGDGTAELVARFRPHFRQSPTIVIYRLSKRGKVSRVREGLAPGRLVPVSGDYLDSHAAGWGVDFSIEENQDDPKARRAIVGIALEDFGGVVEYLTFFHADGREGRGTFIDMTFVEKEKLPESRSCEGFEFSRVLGIAAGRLEGGGKGTYLAASVPDGIYVYRIEGFTSEGFLKKKLLVVPRPEGFKALLPGDEGFIKYEDSKGKVRKLEVTLK
jgi:hypothetical protein